MRDPRPASGTLEVPRRMAGKTLEAPKRSGILRSNLPPAPVRPYERDDRPKAISLNDIRGERQAADEAFSEVAAQQAAASPAIIDQVPRPKTRPRDAERQQQLRAQRERQRELRAAQAERTAQAGRNAQAGRSLQAERSVPKSATTPPSPSGPQPRNHHGTPKPPLSPGRAPATRTSVSVTHQSGSGPSEFKATTGDAWLEQLVQQITQQRNSGGTQRPNNMSDSDGYLPVLIALFIFPLAILTAFIGSSSLFVMGVLIWIGANKLHTLAIGGNETGQQLRTQLRRVHLSWRDPDTVRLHLRILAGMLVVACIVLQWDIIF